MAFVSRILNYLVNEVMVNSLANSRTFQRFAIRSSATVEELAKKTITQKERLAETGEGFFKVFRAELTKGLEDLQRRPPGRS